MWAVSPGDLLELWVGPGLRAQGTHRRGWGRGRFQVRELDVRGRQTDGPAAWGRPLWRLLLGCLAPMLKTAGGPPGDRVLPISAQQCLFLPEAQMEVFIGA